MTTTMLTRRPSPPGQGLDLLALVDAALHQFATHAERQLLSARESALRGELGDVEAALTTLRPPAAEDLAVALAEGREPGPDARASWQSERAALEARRTRCCSRPSRCWPALARRDGHPSGARGVGAPSSSPTGAGWPSRRDGCARSRS